MCFSIGRGSPWPNGFGGTSFFFPILEGVGDGTVGRYRGDSADPESVKQVPRPVNVSKRPLVIRRLVQK